VPSIALLLDLSKGRLKRSIMIDFGRHILVS
jgi:hypothetical protein